MHGVHEPQISLRLARLPVAALLHALAGFAHCSGSAADDADREAAAAAAASAAVGAPLSVEVDVARVTRVIPAAMNGAHFSPLNHQVQVRSWV